MSDPTASVFSSIDFLGPTGGLASVAFFFGGSLYRKFVHIPDRDQLIKERDEAREDARVVRDEILQKYKDDLAAIVAEKARRDGLEA